MYSIVISLILLSPIFEHFYCTKPFYKQTFMEYAAIYSKIVSMIFLEADWKKVVPSAKHTF